MLPALLLTVALAQAQAPAAPAPTAPTAPTAPAAGADNLWLVESLYPGQELLVGRTEEAIHKLLPQGSSDLVGHAALVKLLQERRGGDVACALGDATCTDPLNAYLHGLGLAKLVLIKGGQEESTFRYEVTTTDLVSGEQRQASGSGPNLERALLAALVKVAPLASILKVTSSPTGAELFLDGQRLGVTPYEGQVLPGERSLKLTAPGHQELVATVNIPARGTLAVEKTLELVPSTLFIKPIQKQASLKVDGKDVGKGDVSVPVAAGDHVVEAALEGYEPYLKRLAVPPNGEATDVPDLHPTPELGIRTRTMYLQASFTQEVLRKRKGTYRVNAIPFNKVNGEENPPVGALGLTPGGETFRGVTVDWGQQRDHFGLMLLGFSYLATSASDGTIYAGNEAATFNEAGRHSAPGHPTSLLDLHFVQPQANFVVWHVMGFAQAGLGVRALLLSSPTFTDVQELVHKDGWIDAAPYASVKAGLRFYVFEGAYLTGSYRFTYVTSLNAPQGAFTPLSTTDGFDLGLGYAF